MTAEEAPRFQIREIQAFERDVRLRLPFKFGVITLTGAPQMFLRLRITDERGRDSWGMAAEMLAPKWFDKRTELSNEENFEQLRTSVRLAAEAYLQAEKKTAFELFAHHYPEQVDRCARRDLNPLIAAYGPALLDRAVLDALCRLQGCSFYEAIRRNLPGIRQDPLFDDLAGFDLPKFLSQLRPRNRLHARHTVGLADPITAEDQKPGSRLDDGLPETLEEVIQVYGHRYFKLKVAGVVQEDRERLARIASVLDRIPEPYFVSLDGNEQYESLEGVLELWAALKADRRLSRLLESVIFVEQPVHRENALNCRVDELSSQRPVIIDESDQDFQSYPAARVMGYRGVSSKSCKGFYKSIINAARSRLWNDQEGRPDHYFLTGEDLSTQPGVCVQQDLALVSLLGLGHLERNGHHYVRGMSGIPEGEQQAFLQAHPDLYTSSNGLVRVAIREGEMRLDSLHCPGFGVAAEPFWDAMERVWSLP